MARLHEYQGKAILAANGFKIPRGKAATTIDEALAVAKEVAGKKGGDVVIKIQAWTTGRAGIGGGGLPDKPEEVPAAAARSVEARSLEINPLALTKDGKFVAADCRITIDDYAVARHPELGIEIAREFDHPPTALERVAYAVEQSDHRGTFYFAQLAIA